MSPQGSWTDRLLPDWLGGGSRSPGGADEDDGGGAEHRQLLARIIQQREGLDGALSALPEEDVEAGRRTREAADGLVNRARAAADALEEAGGDGDSVADREELLGPLRAGAEALHEAHFRVIKMRVARDHGDEDAAAGARDGLPGCLETLEEASSSLEDALR